jgi:two-component system sensor histidine kinase YesM
MASIVAGVESLDGENIKRLHELPVLGKPDFQSLVLTINDMLERTEKHNAELLGERQKVFDSELARQKMRMGLLAQQMDAHFVTNTLIGIQNLAARGESEKAAEMAGGLGFLLKHQHKGDVPVNVFDEFLALQKYIEVMNTRHGGKFTYDYELDEALCDYLMPGFIMQPVVENALEHGLGNKEQDARLYIKGFIDNGRVCIEISDNGAGLPPAKLKSVRENLEIAEPSDFPEPGLRGVALMNVQRRIRLQCGNDYGVQIESDFGKGTTVTLTFPLIPENGAGGVV